MQHGKALGAVPMSTVGYERRFNSAIAAARSGREVFVESILEGQPEPPVYFARMKRLNRDGVPLLGDLPVPHAMSAEALAARAGEDDAVVVDTRLARRDYMRAHVRGSLYAPLDKTFPTIVGSYSDPEREILLIVEEARLEEAGRDLVRIGYDRIGGFVPPAEIEALGGLVSTPVVDFGALELLREEPDTTVLDVRGLAEFGEGHVPEALNIAHTRLVPRSGELPPDKELLVYCRTGSRAASAASLLERKGHRVRYVDDEFERWLKMAETVSA